MMINLVGAHNGGVDCSTRRDTYLGGGVIGAWRRALSPESKGDKLNQ